MPGGFGAEITAGQAAGLLARITPADPTAAARCELAAEFLAGLRRPGAHMRGTRDRLAAAVRASATTLTGIFGAGPVIAAAIIAAVGDPGRFGDRDRCRVAPVHCCTGAPSGPRMHVPAHTAQASR